MCSSIGKSQFNALNADCSEQLKKNAREGKHYLRVSMQHLLSFDEPLSSLVRKMPTQSIPALEKAIGRVYKNHYMEVDEFEAPSF